GHDRWCPGHRRGVRRYKVDFVSRFSDWRTQQLRPHQRDSLLLCVAVHIGYVRVDRDCFRDRTCMDDVACRSHRGVTRFKSFGRLWAQRSLVIAQAAMSLVLLSAAALLGQSLRNLQHQKFGFDTQGRYIAWINPSLGNYKPEQMEPLFRQIDDHLQQIPGVRMA